MSYYQTPKEIKKDLEYLKTKAAGNKWQTAVIEDAIMLLNEYEDMMQEECGHSAKCDCPIDFERFDFMVMGHNKSVNQVILGGKWFLCNYDIITRYFEQDVIDAIYDEQGTLRDDAPEDIDPLMTRAIAISTAQHLIEEYSLSLSYCTNDWALPVTTDGLHCYTLENGKLVKH